MSKCGIMHSPKFLKASQYFPKIDFIHVDCDTDRSFCSKLSIPATPTTQLYPSANISQQIDFTYPRTVSSIENFLETYTGHVSQHHIKRTKILRTQNFDKFVKQDFKGQKFIAHCYEGEKPLLRNVLDSQADAVVLVGPEGDFSREEVALAESMGFRSVSLGKSRLRTETAALVSVHLMNLAHVPEN